VHDADGDGREAGQALRRPGFPAARRCVTLGGVALPSVTIDPARFDAAIFDMDGVITDTASVHARCWARLFDEFLAGRPPTPGEDLRPFTGADYLRHVDGRPREDGVVAFLASRGITVPRGTAGDPPDAVTAHALGRRKDAYVQAWLRERGVDVFASTVALVQALRAAGLRTGVFSASRSAREVLASAGVADLFEVRVDGVAAMSLGLPGKPDPATLLEAARLLGVAPGRTVVVEDARAGVEAGRRGGFGLVIGVDRTGQAEELRAHGADVVVRDLVEVAVGAGGLA
jgi:alpha,alpha-trehalase